MIGNCFSYHIKTQPGMRTERIRKMADKEAALRRMSLACQTRRSVIENDKA